MLPTLRWLSYGFVAIMLLFDSRRPGARRDL